MSTPLHPRSVAHRAPRSGYTTSSFAKACSRAFRSGAWVNRSTLRGPSCSSPPLQHRSSTGRPCSSTAAGPRNKGSRMQLREVHVKASSVEELETLLEKELRHRRIFVFDHVDLADRQACTLRQL